MELTKKTTILFSPDQYERLKRLAERRETSVGELVRRACEEQYRLYSVEDRVRAVRELARMSLPVGTPEEMERESVPDPDDLMP